MEEQHLRCFKLNDLEELQKIIYTTIDFSYQGIYPEEAIKYFKDYHSYDRIIDDASEGYTLVLEIKDQIVGTGTLHGSNIRRVFVCPDFQKQGLGRLIMKSLESLAFYRKILILNLEASLSSWEFYINMNYQTVESCYIPLGKNQRLDYYRMQKNLAITSP